MIRERKEPNREVIRQLYPETRIVSDVNEIFTSSEIDLVVIATPNTAHHPLAKEALLHGKHVVVDKPFTITSAEAEELIALSKQQNKVLSVYQNRRFASDARTVKKVLESGLLGRLVEYEVHFDRFRNFLRKEAWREEAAPGTGIWYDLGSHLADQALHLFGLPQAVTGDLRLQRTGSKTVDNFTVVLHYPNLKVTLKSSMFVKEPIPSYYLYGEEGSFIKWGIDIQEDDLKAGKFPANTPNWGEEPEAIWGTLNTTYNGLQFRGKVKSEAGNYPDYYANVCAAINGEAELLVKPEEGRNTMKIIEWGIQSSEEKSTVPCSW